MSRLSRGAALQCHNPDPAAPLMSLNDLRGSASLRPPRQNQENSLATAFDGPPLTPERCQASRFIEKNARHSALQRGDISLSDAEIKRIAARRADSGAPPRQPCRLRRRPSPSRWAKTAGSALRPIRSSRGPEISCPLSPDSWGDVGNAPTGLVEDRYVKSVEVRGERYSCAPKAPKTVENSRFVFHHMNYESSVEGTARHEHVVADS